MALTRLILPMAMQSRAAAASAPALPKMAALCSRTALRGTVPAARLMAPQAREPAPVRGFNTFQPVMMGRRAAKIAKRKGKSDAIRAKVFGKFGKQIIAVAKSGGSADPSANIALADLIVKAKAANVPKELIDRNLKKAADSSTPNFAELTYEAYGFGGVGIVIESLTDNNNRTASDVKDAIRKGGGKVAESGSVMFQFARQGWVFVNGGDEEEVFEVAIDAGAEDIVPTKKGFKVVCEPTSFAAVRDALVAGGFELDEELSRLSMAPNATIEVSDEDYESNVALMDRILELDDVDEVFSNQEEGEDEDEDEE